MKSCDLFKRGGGCLSLIVSFVLGSSIGFCVFWFDNATTPYIDRDTAIQYGLENAQGHCADTLHVRRVDCVHFRLAQINETKDGWFMTFKSRTGRRTDSMIIRRKGEYDSTGGEDLDETSTFRSHKLPDFGTGSGTNKSK